MNNIEYEYKIIITQPEYNKLIDFCIKNFNTKSYVQQNIYFDTKEQTLKNSGSAFRIRNKNNQLEWTFKQKLEDNLKKIELKEKTDSKKFTNLSPNFKNLFKDLNVELNELKMICHIETKRLDVDFYGSTLSLDFNTFNKKVNDYELELEVFEEKSIKKFLELLEHNNIKNVQAESKVARALKYQ